MKALSTLSWYFIFVSLVGIGYFAVKAVMGSIPLFDGGFGIAVILLLAWILIGEVEDEAAEKRGEWDDE